MRVLGFMIGLALGDPAVMVCPTDLAQLMRYHYSQCPAWQEIAVSLEEFA